MTALGGLNDRSVAIAVGGTAQDAIGVNAGRQFLLIQNIDAANDAWVRFGATAAVAGLGSILLKAGGSIVFEQRACPTGRVSVVAATTGHKLTIYEA